MYILFFLMLMSYLCGSIPTGYIIVKKFFKKDIRTLGSGNIGATNVKRITDKKSGIIVQFLDMFKGFVPVFIIARFLPVNFFYINKHLCLSLIALSAIIGHNHTIFLKFKGGKGVSTTVGAFLSLIPIPVICGVLTYYIMGIKIKIVSIRSICIAIVILLMSILCRYNIYYIIMAAIGLIFILIRHKENIKRIINGTEK